MFCITNCIFVYTYEWNQSFDEPLNIKFIELLQVSERVRNWEQRVMEERTSEIYNKMKNKKEEEERQAEEADKKQEIVWREQSKR